MREQPQAAELSRSASRKGICEVWATAPSSSQASQKDDFVTDCAWRFGRPQATLRSRGDLQVNEKYEQRRDGERGFGFGVFFFVYNGDLFVLHLVTNANKP